MESWKATILTWLLMIMMVVTFFVVSSCGTNKTVADNTVMEYALDTVVDRHFVDSICTADTLGVYPVQWVYSPMRGYDSKKDISTYGWMKSSNWTFYRIIKYDDGSYRLTKRVVR